MYERVFIKAANCAHVALTSGCKNIVYILY